LEVSTTTAAHLLRDTLEVRHRLPALWAAVMTGEAEEWVARRVAQATRWLSLEQARWVDAQVVTAVCGLPVGRALGVVEAKVIAADPEGHERRRRERQERRYVGLGRRTAAGVQTLFARGGAGDLARVMALVNHVATRSTNGAPRRSRCWPTPPCSASSSPATPTAQLAKQTVRLRRSSPSRRPRTTTQRARPRRSSLSRPHTTR
jgi:hypothetical protein